MFTTQQFSHATRTLLMALAIVSLSCSGVAFAADQSQNDSGNDNAADSGQAQQETGNDGSNDQNQDDQSNQENKSDQQGQADQQDQTQQDDQQTFIEMQESSQVLASSLIGMSVQNQSSDEGEEIGTVNDLILNEQHQVVGIVVGVGGFLGIGEKNVGISWNAVENVDREAKKVTVVDVNKEELKDAPAFTSQEKQSRKEGNNKDNANNQSQ